MSRKTANGCKVYLTKNVLQAAQERMEWIFNTFKTVSVSVSGGKDSTVLFDLAWREAQRRGRELQVFFLDQEAEYAESLRIVKHIMAHDGVVPHWYQVPCLMTNATSFEEYMLYAYDPGAQADWIHPHVDMSHKDAIPGVNRFYDLMEYVDSTWGENACSLVGLRSEESLNRFGAVTRNPAIPGVNWSSKSKGAVKLYPIYDWTFEDVWTYIGTERLQYHRVYDWMYVKGLNIPNMRVSNLIHEKSFKSLSDLQEFEPATYDRLIHRLKGVRTAALYAKEQMVFSTKKLPARFESWKAYRDFLMDTWTGTPEHLATMRERFSTQPDNETVYRQQVKQLQINDWENNVPVINNHREENPLQKWMDLL